MKQRMKSLLAAYCALALLLPLSASGYLWLQKELVNIVKKIRVFFLVLLVAGIVLSVQATAISPEECGLRPLFGNGENQIVIDEPVIDDDSAHKDVYVLGSAGLHDYAEAAQAQFPAKVELVIDNGVSQAEIAAENVKDVYLKPVQVNENTYIYVNEKGEILSILKINESDAEQGVSASAPRGTSYQIDWDIPAKGRTRGNVNLDTTKGATNVYYKVIFVNNQLTYVGSYHTGLQTYYWYEPPTTTGLDGYFMCATSHAINFALQNAGNLPNTYIGAYSLSPLS